MRVSGNAIRLAALVAAATTSGYLWRAALESPGGTTVIRVAPSAAPPVRVIAAPHDPVSTSGKLHRSAKAVHTTQLAAARVAAPAASTQSSQPTTSPHPSSPPPKPTPAPPPKPAPQPPPKPSPPPPTPSQPAPASSPPVASPPSQRPPQSSPPPTDSTDDTRPGWGNGDKNHHHDGPPGKHG